MSVTEFVCPFTIKCEPGTIKFDTTLMFTFNPIKGGAWKNYTVVWKTIPFLANASGTQTGNLVYTSQLGFDHPQVNKGNMVTPGVNVKSGVGYKTTLIREGQNFNFTKPEKNEDAGQNIVAENKCPAIEPLTVGFFDPKGKYTPALLYENVPQEQSVVAEFTPILKCYSASQYKELQFIKGDVEGYIGWERNLVQVTPDSVFVLTQDFVTGKYTLTLEAHA